MSTSTQKSNHNLRMLHWTPGLLHSTWRLLYISTYTIFWLDNGGTAVGVQQFIAMILPAAVHTYNKHGIIVGPNYTFLVVSWLIAALATWVLFASIRTLGFQVTSGYYEAVDAKQTDKGMHGPNIAYNPMSKMATAGAVLLTGQGILTLIVAYATDVYCLFNIFVTAGMNDDAHGATLVSKSCDLLIIVVTPLFTMFWSIFGPIIVAHIAEHYGDVTYRAGVQKHLIAKHMKETLKFSDSVVEELQDAAQVRMVPQIMTGISQHASSRKSTAPAPKP